MLEAIDDVADRPADDHPERDAHQSRVPDRIAERPREEGEHENRETDQQDRRVPEHPERAVGVLHEGEPQEVGDDEPAFAGEEVGEDQTLRPAVENEDDERDEPEDHEDAGFDAPADPPLGPLRGTTFPSMLR